MQRRVFISSVSGRQITEYRAAAIGACHRVGLQPIAMEEFRPEAPPPLDVCLRELTACDAFVCIIAHRYGSSPPGSDKSFTEHEYECSVARGMPLQVYVVQPDFPWSPMEMEKEPAQQQRLDAFKRRIRETNTVRYFRDVSQFREDLLLYLHDFRDLADDDQREAAVERDIPLPPSPHYVPPYVSSHPFTGRLRELRVLDEWAGSMDPVMVVDAIGGNGKSALTWEWAQRHSQSAIPGFSGCLWWSFYERSASIDAFLSEASAYVTETPVKETRRLSRLERVDELIAGLRARPFLVVLDGFERLLRAYHRFDASKVPDEDVDESARALINHQDDQLVRQLAACHPSKVLVSTRLFPRAFENPTHQRLPGVRRHTLHGLSSAETLSLLSRLGVTGNQSSITSFFDRLGNHPLIIGVVAGLVRDYREAPGDFDRWLADPAEGGSLRMSDLNLVQRRKHILSVAVSGLPALTRLLLGYLAAPTGAVSYEMVTAINPFDGRARSRVFGSADEAAIVPVSFHLAPEDPHVGAVPDPTAQLDRALTDLEDRGLLWWDRGSNTYDLHPIVRAYAYDALEKGARVDANQRIRDYFSALPPEDVDEATSIDDLRQTITIFRSLVGAGLAWSAVDLYMERLYTVLYKTLSAYPTIIELLEPVLKESLSEAQQSLLLHELSLAYRGVGRVGEALRLTETALSLMLQRGARKAVGNAALNLGWVHVESNSLRAAERLGELTHRLGIVAEFDDDLAAHCLLLCAETFRMMGQTKKARETLEELQAARRRSTAMIGAGEPEIIDCRIALQEGTLDEKRLNEASAAVRSPFNHLLVARLRREYWRRAGDMERALEYAEQSLRLANDIGNASYLDEGQLAHILAISGSIDDARTLIERAMSGAKTTHPALRPFLPGAEVMIRCGAPAIAADYAVRGYEVAWGDGPPYSASRMLDQARSLLSQLGVDEPTLPTRGRSEPAFSLEPELLRFLDKIEEETASTGGDPA